MKLQYLVILVPSIIVSSCMLSEKEQSYMDNINQIEYLLDSTASVYNNIDTAKLLDAYERINNNLSRYNELDVAINDSVKVYAAFKKSFKRFMNEHAIILDEISYSKNQLQTLKNDIRNGKITTEQMENYYHEEKDAVGVLIHKVSFNTRNLTYQLASFSQLNDSVEMIIKRLERVKK